MLHIEGPLLTIDVDSRETRTEDIDGVLSSFVGGRGVGTKLAHDRILFDADPFGPENSLVIEKENHNSVLDSSVVCKFSRDFMTEERVSKPCLMRSTTI